MNKNQPYFPLGKSRYNFYRSDWGWSFSWCPLGQGIGGKPNQGCRKVWKIGGASILNKPKILVVLLECIQIELPNVGGAIAPPAPPVPAPL